MAPPLTSNNITNDLPWLYKDNNTSISTPALNTTANLEFARLGNTAPFSVAHNNAQSSIGNNMSSYLKHNDAMSADFKPTMSGQSITEQVNSTKPTPDTKTDSYDWGGTAIKGFEAFTAWKGLGEQKRINNAIIDDNNRRYQLMLSQYNDLKKTRATNAARSEGIVAHTTAQGTA